MKLLYTLLLSLFLCSTIFAQNNGIALNGTDGSIPLCDSEDFNIGDGFTIEAWVFSPQWRGESWQGSILAKDRSMPGGFAFRAGKNGILSFVMAVDGNWFEVVTDEIMNTNQWYHVAVTVDGGTIRLYINGVQQATGTFSGSPTHNSRITTIGASPSFPGRVWNGALDEIRVWNVARTSEQIFDNQGTEYTGMEDGLIAYLPFNEGSGTTAVNLAGENCDGMLTGLDDSAWQEGWTIPAIDVGIGEVSAPDAISLYHRPVKPRVSIYNYGSEAVSEIPLRLSINSLPVLTVTYSGTIAPGESVDYVFETPLDLTGNNTNILTVTTTLDADLNSLNNSTTYRYRKPRAGNEGELLRLLFEEKHNFGNDGQTQFTTVNMPEDMENYAKLLLHLSVKCPTGGCDPWDQPANVFVINEAGEEFEIARFITPFGIGCGGDEWVVDVTDFKYLLSGQVTIKSYIQVWGPSGWLLDADLEFIEGPSPLHQKTTPLWADQYHVYGDPGIEDDLSALTNTMATNTEESRFRLTITGHGQGNTDNAAEFANKTHSLMINGELAASHNLWKTDCAENDCANQNGTWLFSRAGWCPGQAVTPFVYDLGGDLFAGQEITFDYELEAYVNLENTNYNDSDHTEPHYRIAGYLVEESETHFSTQTNLRADSVTVAYNSDQMVTVVFTNTGSEMVSAATVAYFVDGELGAEETITADIAAGASYEHTFASTATPMTPEDQEVIAVVTTTNDDNVNDDATNTVIFRNTTSVQSADDAGVSVFPNPSSGEIQISLTPEFYGATLEAIDATGRILQSVELNSTSARLNIKQSGLIVLRFRSAAGREYFKKIVVK